MASTVLISVFCCLLLCRQLSSQPSTQQLLSKIDYEILDTWSLVASELAGLRLDTAFRILVEDSVRIGQLVDGVWVDLAISMISIVLPTVDTVLYLGIRLLVMTQVITFFVLNVAGAWIYYEVLMNKPVSGKVVLLYLVSVSNSDRTRGSQQALNLILVSILPDWLQRAAAYCVQHPEWLRDSLAHIDHMISVDASKAPDLGDQTMIPGNGYR